MYKLPRVWSDACQNEGEIDAGGSIGSGDAHAHAGLVAVGGRQNLRHGDPRQVQGVRQRDGRRFQVA